MTRSESLTVLAIESSCDETAAAVVTDSPMGPLVLSSVVSSQIEVHAPFGGVVPELASRHHLGSTLPVVRGALEKAGQGVLERIDAVAVTEGPGLVGALLVGVQTARGLAAARGLPVLGIHHMEGHLCSAFMGDHAREPIPFEPHLALLVSGGHTELVDVKAFGRYEVIGATRDDAVGEAFDKVAKLLGLGYPGGPVIDSLALDADPRAVDFPRPMLTQDNLDFSFAGVKTAVMVHVDRYGQPQSKNALANLCASFQQAVVDVLVHKTMRAVQKTGHRIVVVVGGAAANRQLRHDLDVACRGAGCVLRCAPLRYCGDNAAMIGAAAIGRLRAGARSGVEIHTSTALDDPGMRL